MFVELAAKGLKHSNEGRDWMWRCSEFIVAARVLDACHARSGEERVEVGDAEFNQWRVLPEYLRYGYVLLSCYQSTYMSKSERRFHLEGMVG